MNFGQALMHLKNGERVARVGWNGKGMFVFLSNGSIPADADANLSFGETYLEQRPAEPGDELYGEDNAVVVTKNGVAARLFDIGDNGTTVRMPSINMRAADGSTVVGWLASQTDMLAEDWVLA